MKPIFIPADITFLPRLHISAILNLYKTDTGNSHASTDTLYDLIHALSKASAIDWMQYGYTEST